MKNLLPLLSAALLLSLPAHAEEEGIHLFLLSGQSNMAGLDPKTSFIPAVEKEFGKANVIVIKDAKGGEPMRRWYKDWKPAKGDKPDAPGDLYDRLMQQVMPAIKGKEIATVTFLWMQGERDAKEGHASVYEKSLTGLLDQLEADLDRKDVNFVVGRLSDFDMKNKTYKDWTAIREAQVDFADAEPERAWVDTDDLNDLPAKNGKGTVNDLHYSKEGYKTFGKRLAEKAIALVRRK